MILLRLKCSVAPLACFSQIKWSCKEVLEMHKGLPLYKKPSTINSEFLNRVGGF